MLGRNLFRSLQMQVIDGQFIPAPSYQPTSTVKSVAVQKLGCAKGVVHRVKVRPDVKPVQRLPFSACRVFLMDFTHSSNHKKRQTRAMCLC